MTAFGIGSVGSPVDVATFILVLVILVLRFRPRIATIAAAVVALAEGREDVDDDRLRADLPVDDDEVAALRTRVITDGGQPQGALDRARRSVVGALGPAAIHALEDGAVVGVVVGLALTWVPGAVIILAAFGVHPKRVGPLSVVREVVEIVRSADARKQESFFVGALLVGAKIGLEFGPDLAAAAPPALSVGAADLAGLL